MTVKSVSMIAWEFDPIYVRGGTAYAIRRLSDQLTALGIETTVLLPDLTGCCPAGEFAPSLRLMPLKMRAKLRRAPRLLQCAEFCRVATEAVEQISNSARLDAVIAHSDEAALFVSLRNRKGARETSVFWLHSLYDPPTSDLPKEQRRLLPSQSLLASAVMTADIVVTSRGILKDARDFEWPDRLKELQKALITASAEQRMLTVESVGCLPSTSKHSEKKHSPNSNLKNLRNVPPRYVLFPCRPMVDKGLGIFVAIAERLRDDHIRCVAVRPPAPRIKPEGLSQNGFVHWWPWLTQEELLVAMRSAACTVLPSITEGFGLAAAESISLGVPTLYHEVGGHHGLHPLPNALPIPLTANERAQLYLLWSELVNTHPDSWSVWSKHAVLLRPLIDKWVEAIRSVLDRTDGGLSGIEKTQLSPPPMSEAWGNRLRRRIEVGVV